MSWTSGQPDSMWDRYVRRLRDVSDPKCEYEETCFCLPYNRMPKAEQIATVLLELTNNPELFERWAAQIGAVKADGQVFACAQVIGSRWKCKPNAQRPSAQEST